MTTQYYEDVKLHQMQRTRGYLLTDKDIIDFGKQWDPEPMHIDTELAKGTRIGTLIASGIHLLAITKKLLTEFDDRPRVVAAGGLDELRFLSPGKPGDVLTAEVEAVAKRESKTNPGSGIVTYHMKLLNQREEAIFIYKATVILERRPGRA